MTPGGGGLLLARPLPCAVARTHALQQTACAESERQRFRGTGVTEYLAGFVVQSGLAPVNLTTLPHFSVSSARSLPKSAGESASGALPTSASRALILGSARAALTSVLSFATISAGVFLGAPMPRNRLA